MHAQRLQPGHVVGDADGTEPFELAQQKPQGVTVGIDPLLPLPASLLRRLAGRRGVLDGVAQLGDRDAVLPAQEQHHHQRGAVSLQVEIRGDDGIRVVRRLQGGVQDHGERVLPGVQRVAVVGQVVQPSGVLAGSQVFAVALHELGFFGQPEENRVHAGRLNRRSADFAGKCTQVGEERGSPRLGGEFRLVGQADRRQHRRKLERLLEVYAVPVGRFVVEARHVVLVQVDAVRHAAVPEVQDETILIRHSPPA